MTDNTALATSWLQALAARGVAVGLRNGRIELRPAVAYKDLSDDERATLRHQRSEIKAIVAAGGARPTPNVSPVLAPPAPPPPARCDFCYQTLAGCATLKTEQPDLWRVFHSLDPEEVARRDAEATAEMMATLGKPHPWAR